MCSTYGQTDRQTDGYRLLFSGILRPHDICRQAFMFGFCFCFFQTNPGQTRAAASRQKYIRRLVLGSTWQMLTDSLPTPPLNFTGGSKSAKFWLDFWHQSPLTHCGFKTGELFHKSNTFTLSDDDWASFWRRHFSLAPFTNSYRESDVKYFEIWPTFDLWGSVVAKWSSKSKSWILEYRVARANDWPVFLPSLMLVAAQLGVSNIVLLKKWTKK